MGGRPNTGVVAGRAPGDVPGMAAAAHLPRGGSGYLTTPRGRCAGPLRGPGGYVLLFLFVEAVEYAADFVGKDFNFTERRGTLVPGRGPRRNTSAVPRIRPLRDPRRKYQRPTRASVPARAGRRNTGQSARAIRPGSPRPPSSMMKPAVDGGTPRETCAVCAVAHLVISRDPDTCHARNRGQSPQAAPRRQPARQEYPARGLPMTVP